MTISTTTRRKNQTADGIQTVFAYDFLVLDETHIEVYLDGDETTPLTGYTVTGVGSEVGGTVVFSPDPPAAGTLTIARVVPRTQTYDYIVRGRFPSDTHERLADLLVMMVQEVEDKVNRSIRLNIDTTYEDLSIPDPEAGKILKWKDDLSGLENIFGYDLGTLVISAFGQTLIDDADADAFWATLIATLTKHTARNAFEDSVTHNFTADADYTPTSAQLEYGRLVFTDTGAVLTTDRNIILPTNKRVYLIQNDTTFSLTIKTSAGTGILVAPSEAMLLYADGTNVVNPLTGTSGGATGGGPDDIFYENSQTVNNDYTITSGKNAHSAGPITIASGVTVTVPSGSRWVIS